MGENSCKTATAVVIVLLLLIAAVVIAYFATDHFGMDGGDDSTPQYLTPGECMALNGTVYNGFCYTNTDLLLSWPDAQTFCVNQAPTGSLASIKSAGDNDWVSHMAFNRSSMQSLAWFGLNDQATEGSFVFVRDGASLAASSYTSWVSDSSPGAPLTDPDASFQDCATMLKSPLGLWRMSLCTELHVFVCQYQLASLPDAPGTPSATAAVGAALVSFGSPSSDGGDAITSYTVISTPGSVTANGTGSPIAVRGLTVGVSYTFRVYATNGVGDGPLSAPSNAVVPVASVADAPIIGMAAAGAQAAAISFTPPAFDGLSTITSYHLKTYLSSDTSTVLMGSSYTAQAATSPIVISTLTNGQSYQFRVYATNAIGDSIDSALSNIVVPASGVPTQPQNVVATALNRGARVTFAAPFSDGGSPITVYTIWAYLANAPSGSAAVANATVTSVMPVVFSDLTVGVSYAFTVVATSNTGNSLPSTLSNSVLVFAVAPGAPTAVGVTAGGARVWLQFNAPADDGGAPILYYHVNATDTTTSQHTIYAFDASLLGTISPITADVKPLLPGDSYTFTVAAVNSVGPSAPSNSEGPISPIVDVPDAPWGVMAVAGSRSALVSWQQPHNGGDMITSYSVYIHPGSMVLTGVTALNATVMNLTASVNYNFTVVAINSHGPSTESLRSNTVAPFASAPSKPYFVSASPQPLSATIYFAPPDDNGGSPILYYYIVTTPARESMAGGDQLPAGWNRGTSSPITLNYLKANVGYKFQIVAHNAYGDSPPSDLPPTNTVVGVGIPDAPTQVFAVDDGDRAVKVSFSELGYDGGDPIQNFTVTSNPGQIRVTTSSSPASFSDMPDGTYRFIVYATNHYGNSLPSLQSNPISISSHQPALLGLWIVLGILGFIGILVALYFLRKCLLTKKNRDHNKISKQTNDNGDNELVIVKDGNTKDLKSTSADNDLEDGNTTDKTSTTNKSTDPDDESNWVSHN